eukprot:TRINITY_DN10509_c0_g1_i3.p2 TRINITY_DN10509_c0_g1~~TRINITY_DN10509_c0_g1_i3.p2  ORF type:complete len:125 (+),score=34.58 TRINITY_DN10509_c0_g1_i3:164-538(+)
MLRSLVGSEMCIRDRSSQPQDLTPRDHFEAGAMHEAFVKRIKELECEVTKLNLGLKEEGFKLQTARLRFGWRLLMRYTFVDHRSLLTEAFASLCDGLKQHKIELLRDRRNSVSRIPMFPGHGRR